MKIAEYYASLGFRVSRTEIRRVDKYLKDLEKRLANFGKGINKKFALQVSSFKVDDKKLNAALGNALDKASTKLVFEISKFAVNDRALQAALMRAARRTNARAGGLPQQTQQRVVVQETRQAARETARSGRNPSSYSRANYLHAGGAAGAFMRYGAASLPFIGGVYGMGALNRANQEALSARLTTQAVIQGRGGTEQEGKDAFAWLRNLANDVGFNYMEAAPEYNQFLSNALGAGLTTSGAQNIFQGFSEYQTAMGVTPARRKLVQNALSQMLGKGKVSMEELRRQMAESLPGTMDAFAEAIAEMTGSGLTGQAAIEAMYAAVESGNVNSAEVLPIVSRILAERAQPKLGVMKKSSIAEQARAQNQVADWVASFGASGGEQGFARMWKSLAIALKESAPLAERLGKAFNEFSKYVSFVTLLPQSIQRAFEGRDSWFADFIGKERMDILKGWWDNQKGVYEEVKKLLDKVVEGWKLIFEMFGTDMLSFVDKFSLTLMYLLKALNAVLDGDFTGAKNATLAYSAIRSGATAEQAAKIAAGESVASTGVDESSMWLQAARATPLGATTEVLMRTWQKAFSGSSNFIDQQKTDIKGIQAIYGDPKSPFYQDWNAAKDYYENNILNQPLSGGGGNSGDTYNIQLNVDPATLQRMDVEIQASKLAEAFRTVLQSNPAQ